MNSSVFYGEVSHQRLAPVKHAFRYGVYFFGLELDELSRLNGSTRLFGYNCFRPFSLWDKDYLEKSSRRVEEKVRDWISGAGGKGDAARVVLVTCARYFHYVFNPVSFYLCFDEDDELSCLLAEVNNTFGERHVYVMHQFQRLEKGWKSMVPERKAFHVSPFNDMQGHYEFMVSRSGTELEIQANLFREGKPYLLASLRGTADRISDRSLLKTMLRFPIRAVLTMPRIIMEAGKLYFSKRLKVFAKPEPSSEATIQHRVRGLSRRPLVRAVFSLLGRIQEGRLRIVLPDGQYQDFGEKGAEQAALLHVRSPKFFRKVVTGGSVGFGEAFVAGDWDSPDPTAVLALLGKNQPFIQPEQGLVSSLSRGLNTVLHRFRKNTLKQSRKNIQDHYDLGNDFYQTFLDDTMTYSSALYLDGDESMEQAQLNKLRRLIDRLDIRPGHHVLEIGSGWGSCAIEMARSTGCRVTSITLSEEQCRLARQRVEEAGLSEQVDIRICDYRNLEGRFDRVISIEMVEAVGHEFHTSYFKTIDRVLKPGGKVGLQSIMIPEDRYEAYRGRCDWIQKYIFPGGFLPSLEALQASWSSCTPFKLTDDFEFGHDYARTLAWWRDRFMEHRDDVLRQGFDETFIRKWIYYLCYCEAGFATDMIAVRQLILERGQTSSDAVPVSSSQ